MNCSTPVFLVFYHLPESAQTHVHWVSDAIQPSHQLFISSVQFSHSVVSNSLRPHGLHARLPCPSPTPRAYSNLFSASRQCHPPLSFSVIPFASHLQSFPAWGSFLMSQLFASGGQSMGASASASVLPMNIQAWSLGWTGLISLQSKGLSRVLSRKSAQCP